jgi:hypothetical protein
VARVAAAKRGKAAARKKSLAADKEAAATLQTANELLRATGAEDRTFQSIEDLKRYASPLLVALFESLFRLELVRVHRKELSEHDHVVNAQEVIDSVSGLVAPSDRIPDYVTGTAIAAGDLRAIKFMLVLLATLQPTLGALHGTSSSGASSRDWSPVESHHPEPRAVASKTATPIDPALAQYIDKSSPETGISATSGLSADGRPMTAVGRRRGEPAPRDGVGQPRMTVGLLSGEAGDAKAMDDSWERPPVVKGGSPHIPMTPTLLQRPPPATPAEATRKMVSEWQDGPDSPWEDVHMWEEDEAALPLEATPPPLADATLRNLPQAAAALVRRTIAKRSAELEVARRAQADAVRMRRATEKHANLQRKKRAEMRAKAAARERQMELVRTRRVLDQAARERASRKLARDSRHEAMVSSLMHKVGVERRREAALRASQDAREAREAAKHMAMKLAQAREAVLARDAYAAEEALQQDRDRAEAASALWETLTRGMAELRAAETAAIETARETAAAAERAWEATHIEPLDVRPEAHRMGLVGTVDLDQSMEDFAHGGSPARVRPKVPPPKLPTRTRRKTSASATRGSRPGWNGRGATFGNRQMGGGGSPRHSFF